MVNQLLIDIDGCVIKYNFPKLIKKWFGVSIPNGDLYAYSIEDCLGVSSEDVCNMFAVEVFAPPEFIKGARESLVKLINLDYSIGIFTNRLNFMSKQELESWLGLYGIPYSSIVTNKSLPSYVYAMIDDSPDKLMTVDKVTEVKNLLLFSNPWNEKCLNITGKLQRVKNWKEVMGRIGY